MELLRRKLITPPNEPNFLPGRKAPCNPIQTTSLKELEPKLVGFIEKIEKMKSRSRGLVTATMAWKQVCSDSCCHSTFLSQSVESL